MNSPLPVTSSAARYGAENVFLASFQRNLRESKHKRNGLLFISLTFGSSSSSLFGLCAQEEPAQCLPTAAISKGRERDETRIPHISHRAIINVPPQK